MTFDKVVPASAKSFLRGDTEHLQPNMLAKVVLRNLEGMDDPDVSRVKMIRELPRCHCTRMFPSQGPLVTNEQCCHLSALAGITEKK